MSKEQTNNSKQAAWTAIGSLFSFGFSIVSSMILSRYFDKADYGTYKQAMYVYNTLLTVFALGLPGAYTYFLPRVDVGEAKSLIKKITNIFFVLGAVFSILLFTCSEPIARFMNNDDLAGALRIFAPVPLLMLPTMGLEGILSTFRKNRFMTYYTVSTRLFMLLCVSLPVIAFGKGYREALYGFVFSSVINFVLALYLKYLPVKNEANNKTSVGFKDIFSYSLPMLTASLWGILLHSSDQFFISRYFGSEVFAEFSNGAIPLPFVGMIAGACSVVLSPIISKIASSNIDPKKELYPLWLSVFEKSAKLVYPLLIYCIFFSDIIMIILYGGKYENSSIYFRIKSIISFFDVIIYAPLVINIGKVKYYSNVHMLAAIAIVCLEYFSILIINSPYAISVVSLLVNLGKSFALLWIVSRYFNIKIHQLFPIRVLSLILLPSCLILGLEHYILIDVFSLKPIICLIISFCIYAMIFVLYSYFVKLDYLSIIKPILKK